MRGPAERRRSIKEPAGARWHGDQRLRDETAAAKHH